jgi:hypothetical protein
VHRAPYFLQDTQDQDQYLQFSIYPTLTFLFLFYCLYLHTEGVFAYMADSAAQDGQAPSIFLLMYIRARPSLLGRCTTRLAGED